MQNISPVKKQSRMQNFLFPAALQLCLFYYGLSLNAQTTATWKGNKPGQPTAWDCAANWREGRVPNAFSQVVIPAGVAAYPVIKDAIGPIDALLVESGASLTLQQNGFLCILNETGRFDGMLVLGAIYNNGFIEVQKKRKGSLTVAL